MLLLERWGDRTTKNFDDTFTEYQRATNRQTERPCDMVDH